MMRRIIALTALFIVCTLLFTACGKKQQTVTDEDGNMLKYTAAEITENGFYVHDKKADTFSPVLSGFSGYEGMPSAGNAVNMDELIKRGDDGVRYIWMSDTDIQPLDLVPVVDGRKTELILWMDEQDEMPSAFTLEKYRKLGYTIGTHVTFGESGTKLYLSTDDPCKSSNAESVLKKNSASDGLLEISRINKSKDLPLKNVDPEINMLLGLQKDKKYQIGYFDGTQYEDIDVVADTLAFKSQKVYELASPYNTTEANYFVVNLPKNIKSGYYYINDAGMFGFKAKEINDSEANQPTVAPTEATTTKETENTTEEE